MNSYGSNALTSPLTNQGKDTVTVRNNVELNAAHVDIVTVDAGSKSALPSINSAHPTLAGYTLTGIEGEDLPASLYRATLTYTCYFQSIPDTSYREETSIRTKPIQEHPSFSDWVTAGYWDATNGEFLSSSPLYGVAEYRAPTCTVTKTEYFSSMPSSRFTDLTKLEKPASSYDGDDTNWMIIGAPRSQRDALWIRETVYEYDDDGWDTDVYSTVS